MGSSKTPRQNQKQFKLLRAGIATLVVAQAAALTAVHVIDRLRRARIPGGVPEFPVLPGREVAVDDGYIRTYTDGGSLYSDMLEAIESAEDHIYFETYVWRSDVTGHMFKDALYEAADRGVEVFIAYDGFGSLNANPLFKIFPKHPHVHVHRLAEVRPGILTLNPRRTGRTHRKLLVVDDEVGFIGGYNIGDDFGTEWRDTHVRVSGSIVKELAEGFVDYWNHFRSRRDPHLLRRYPQRWQAPVSAAFNLPSRLLFPVRGLYLDAFEKASETILITMAYFIPDREIQAALKSAASRGVKIKVLIPEYSNHILADWVARPFYGDLLKAGVEIWLYKHAMVHAKTMTVDEVWSTVGTANVDRLSLMGNFEINLQIYSPEFAKEMERIFQNDLTTARRLTLEEWESRTKLTRATERLLQPLAPIL